MYALLIAVESDESAILSLVLQRTGLAVTMSRSVERACQSWSDRPADLVLAALSSEQALEQVVRLRSETVVPLAVVLDPVSEEVHSALLEAGSDLVVQRPYSSRVMISQMRALLRRGGGVPLTTLPVLSLSGLTLDPATHTIRQGENPPRRLTHLEFRLMYALMVHRGQVLPTETIVQRVWGYTEDAGSRELVRGLISRLRSKVEPDSQKPKFILTVPNVGYTFTGEET